MDSATQTVKPAGVPVPTAPSKKPGVYDIKEGWKCDCNPRAPALHKQTKKENENKGRWFFRCPKWSEGCNLFMWEDEAQARVDEIMQHHNQPTSTVPFLPALPPYAPPEPPAWVRVRTPVPSPRPRDGEKNKHTPRKSLSVKPKGERNEEEGSDLTDIDSDLTYDPSQYSDVPSDTTDDETATPKVETSRKERRTTTKNSPSKETAKAGFAGHNPQTSFAGTSSFVTAQTSFTSGPVTPSTGHRKRRSHDATEEDIFTTGPLTNRPTNNLLSKLVSGPTFNPETPKDRKGKHPSFQLPTPKSPDNPRGQTGPETPSATKQDVFAFLPELGKISEELQDKLFGLMNRQARQAEGFRRARDITRNVLKERDEEIVALKKRIEELEEEKEASRQINENLKSQLEDLRVHSLATTQGSSKASRSNWS